jgi:hypothetical protein
MNDQHARLSQTLAEQGITERRAQAPSRASAAGVGGLRSHPPPTGTWTINPADPDAFDDVPPVGVIRVQQPSGLPVRTISTQVDLIADGCTACQPASVRSEFSTERGASEGQARPSAGSGHSKRCRTPNTMTGQPARPGADRDAA